MNYHPSGIETGLRQSLRGGSNLWPQQRLEFPECDSYMRDLLYAGSEFEASPEDAFCEGILEGRRLQQEDDQVLFSRYRGRLDRMRQQRDDARLIQLRHRDEVELLKIELAQVKDTLFAVQLAYEEFTLSRVGRELLFESSPQTTSAPQDTSATNDLHERDSSDANSISSINSWPSDVPSFEDEEAFDVMQQLHLMDEWDQEDADWVEHIHRESDDADEPPSSPPFQDSESDTSSPPSSIVNLGTAECNTQSYSSQNSSQNSPLSIAELDSLMAAAQYPTNDKSALKQVRWLLRAAHGTPQKKRSGEQLHLMATWRTPSPSRLSSASASSGVPSSESSPSDAVVRPSGTPEIFVDASAHGIGLIFNDRWLAWKFTPKHPSIPLGPDDHIIMSWAELIAVELGLLTVLAAGYSNTKIKLRSDNEGVVMALKKGKWLPRYDLDNILQRILRLCQGGGILLQTVWISTKVNPADRPSRGAYPPRGLMLEHHPDIPQQLVGLVREVDPSSLKA